MALATGTIALIAAISAAVVGTASYVSAEKSRKQAQAYYSSQAQTQREVRSEQAALNAQAAAGERRQQIREERVRRAKILQAAEGTGVSGSSGELGSTGGLATQLGANIGTNLGTLSGTGRINQLAQTAADFGTAAQSALNNQAKAMNNFNLSMSIFQSAGGFGAGR